MQAHRSAQMTQGAGRYGSPRAGIGAGADPFARDEAAELPAWFVQAGGRVWGPYTGSRIAVFAQEGRVDGATPVARAAEGPFAPAERWPPLAAFVRAWPEPAAAPAPAPLAPSPAAQRVEPAPAPTAEPAPARPLLVFGRLATLSEHRFEAVLAAYGAYQAVAPGLWLVRGRLGAAALRNALSRRLQGTDTLLVVEAPLDAAAWFNLDADAERTLRRLWAGG